MPNGGDKFNGYGGGYVEASTGGGRVGKKKRERKGKKKGGSRGGRGRTKPAPKEG